MVRKMTSMTRNPSGPQPLVDAGARFSSVVSPVPLYSPRIALHDQVDSGLEAAPVIPALKMRLDDALGDVERGDIGQHAFQPVADLDEHLAVLDENEKDGAVIRSLSDRPPTDCVTRWV